MYVPLGCATLIGLAQDRGARAAYPTVSPSDKLPASPACGLFLYSLTLLHFCHAWHCHGARITWHRQLRTSCSLLHPTAHPQPCLSSRSKSTTPCSPAPLVHHGPLTMTDVLPGLFHTSSERVTSTKLPTAWVSASSQSTKATSTPPRSRLPAGALTRRMRSAHTLLRSRRPLHPSTSKHPEGRGSH